MPPHTEDQAKRMVDQIDPVVKATEKLRAEYISILHQPSGHPNLHPVRAAMKELETALEAALGQMSRSRREDELELQQRQSRVQKQTEK